MSLEIGQLIEGKYRIVKLIGEGGMGAVYEGENVRISRRVAIKVLHAAYTGNAEVMQRFEREAQAAGRIGNDHILEVLDLGQLGDGDHYIVMEFLDGAPLAAWIKSRGRLSPQEITPIMLQALVGLGAAHSKGIVHRDLKPDNIFILKEKAGKKDFVKIIDFGISKFQPLSGDGMKMTRTGAVMGTPYYMSPEQASGSHDADQRSDIYALGVILYESVTGRVPFDGDTFNQLMFKIVLADVPPPESIVLDLDPAFSSIIAKAMSRDVNHRFQTTQDFSKALTEWQQSGRAVTIPPAADPGASGLLPSGARASAFPAGTASANPQTPGLGASHVGTGPNWATSQPEAQSKVPKRAGPLAAVVGIGVLVLGGGAFAAYSAFSPKAPLAEPSVAQSASSPPPAPEAPPARVPEPTAPPVVEPPAAPSAAPSQSTPVTAAPKAAPRPAAAKPAAPKPASKPASKPAAKPRAGGMPDFGY